MTVPLDDKHDSNYHNDVTFIIRTAKDENITTRSLSPSKQEELSVGPEGEGLMVNPVRPEDEGLMVNLVGPEDEGLMINPKECSTEDKVASEDLYSNMNLKNGEKNHVKRNTGTEESISATSSFLLWTIVACMIINLKTIFDSYKILTKSDILYHKPKLKVFCESTFSGIFLKDSVITTLTKRFQRVFSRDETTYILYPQEYSSFLANKKGDMTTKESMQFEWCRLSSYASFPNSSVSVIRLAEAGFYFGGNGDEVICPFCGLKRCNWNSNDNPKIIHIEESRDLNCSFVASQLRPVLFKETTAQEETNVHRETTGASGFTDHGESNSQIYSNEPALTLSKNRDNRSVISESVSFPKSATSTATCGSSIEVGQTCQKTELRNKFPEFKPETSQLPNTVHSNYSTNDVTGLIRIPKEGNKTNPPKGDKTPVGAHHSGFNAEFNTMGVCLDKPKYPSYAVRTTRLSSFQHWPSYLTQSPEELAMAGFFYTGIEDHCRCFFCGGGLRRWENGDFPWTEHARWFPKCPFVLQCKGQKYVDDVQLGRDPEQREQLSPPGEEEPHGIPNGFMNNPAVQIVSELGYEPDILISAFESLKHSGVDSITASLLLEAVFELEGNRRSSPVTSSNERTNKEESLSGHIQKNEHPEIARNTDPCHELSIRSLEEENRNLKDQQTCKICLDEPVSIVFLPCGHMAACVNCAPALRRCPICRAFIKGTVKAIIC